MKILLLSDLHHEFDRTLQHTKKFVSSLNNNIEFLFLAGDIVTWHKMEKVLGMYSDHFENSEIVYVPGNHEFAGIEQVELYTLFGELTRRHSNLNIFHEEFKQSVHKNIIAGTMWYKNAISCYLSCPDWFDFKYIPNSVKFIRDENERFLNFLEKNLNEESIVITHMLPSWKCVATKYATSRYNKFFVCDVEQLILDRQPKLWMFGHTHHSFDFFIGKMRLICNPKGYVLGNGKLENPCFNKEMIIDL